MNLKNQRKKKEKEKENSPREKKESKSSTDSDSDSDDNEVFLTRKEEELIEEQLLNYISSNRIKGNLLNDTDVEKYKQTLCTEKILAKKVEKRKNKEKSKAEKKKKAAEKKKKRIEERSKKAEGAQGVKPIVQNLENEKMRKIYNMEMEERKKAVQKDEYDPTVKKWKEAIKCFTDSCVADTRHDQMLVTELIQLKQLIDKMRSKNDDDEFTYKEIREILHYISTSTYKKEKLLPSLKLLLDDITISK